MYVDGCIQRCKVQAYSERPGTEFALVIELDLAFIIEWALVWLETDEATVADIERESH
jgi:hypothetical protein